LSNLSWARVGGPGCSPGRGRSAGAFRNAGAVWRPLGVSDELVGKEGEAVTDDLGVDEAQGFLVAGLAEQALAGPEHDRVDEQPQLVDEVVLDQRAPELIAGVDDDVPGYLLLQLRDRSGLTRKRTRMPARRQAGIRAFRNAGGGGAR